MTRTLADFLTKRTFRWFLVIEFVTWTLGEVANYAFLPNEIADWIEHYTPEFGWLGVVVMVPAVVALIGSYLGLWLFRNWGRLLLLATALMTAPVEGLFGPCAVTGIGAVLTSLGMYMSGALLVIVYLPPVSVYFEERRDGYSSDPKR